MREIHDGNMTGHPIDRAHAHITHQQKGSVTHKREGTAKPVGEGNPENVQLELQPKIENALSLSVPHMHCTISWVCGSSPLNDESTPSLTQG